MNFPKWISNFLSAFDLIFFFRIIRFAELYEHDENISQTELAKWNFSMFILKIFIVNWFCLFFKFTYLVKLYIGP